MAKTITKGKHEIIRQKGNREKVGFYITGIIRDLGAEGK